ncbi:hypothetical protein Tco_1129882 [Tanacetum coccineum]
MVVSSSSLIHEEFQGTEKEGSVTLHYPMLTKTNYFVWAIKMRVIPEDVLLMLADKDTAKEAWETLHTMHMGADKGG